jgi:predicted O-linked N-acetylglucosamine transferase (SPINDLY family)
MAASILKGALPKNPSGDQAAVELVAEDDDDYEKKAIKLTNGISYRMAEGGYGEAKGRLWELRKLLFGSKWNCALFNTRRWVSDLEGAYEEAWRRWVAGIDGDIYL